MEFKFLGSPTWAATQLELFPITWLDVFLDAIDKEVIRNAADHQRKEDQARNDQDLRPEEGQKGLLREPKQGHDQKNPSTPRGLT